MLSEQQHCGILLKRIWSHKHLNDLLMSTTDPGLQYHKDINNLDADMQPSLSVLLAWPLSKQQLGCKSSILYSGMNRNVTKLTHTP